jgi:hypothetical protein
MGRGASPLSPTCKGDIVKIEILKPFRSRKFQRSMKKGEVVNAPKAWAEKIEGDGLGKIIAEPPAAPKVQNKSKNIPGKNIETASLEVPHE